MQCLVTLWSFGKVSHFRERIVLLVAVNVSPGKLFFRMRRLNVLTFLSVLFVVYIILLVYSV